MRKHIDVYLADRHTESRAVSGIEAVKAGRYLIGKTLLDMGVAEVDPLSPENPLIFSAGPFAGSTFSNANRTSVGCKSPLTGGIKEANGGGTFGYGMGHLRLSSFILHGASPDWVVIHFKKDATQAAKGLGSPASSTPANRFRQSPSRPPPEHPIRQ